MQEYTREKGEPYGMFAQKAPPAGVPDVAPTALAASQTLLAISDAGYDVLVVDPKRSAGGWSKSAFPRGLNTSARARRWWPASRSFGNTVAWGWRKTPASDR
ncbi:MAG: hypothetical protein ACR2HJ_01390 [Fimbriimonadales bacterium]